MPIKLKTVSCEQVPAGIRRSQAGARAAVTPQPLLTDLFVGAVLSRNTITARAFSLL
jgi:hypothetical protein